MAVVISHEFQAGARGSTGRIGVSRNLGLTNARL